MTQHVSDRSPADAESIDPPRLNEPSKTTKELTAFIQRALSDAGADGVVVNLSGGIDSTVTATLATEALGSENVYGLILPANTNSNKNIDHAHRVAEELVIDHEVIEIQPLLDQFAQTLTRETHELKRDPMSDATARTVSPIKDREGYREALGNAAARIRMMIAYFEANTTSRLVLGTGNRTELLLGYFTKYGDGGVDCLPIGDLYKTQVRDLARHLEIREDIVKKPPTAGLWAEQTDESELGASYETIDTILHRLIDKGDSALKVANAVNVDIDKVRTYAQMYERAAHKRNPPPTPSDY